MGVHYFKTEKYGSVLDWRTVEHPDQALESVALDDIWGISKRWSNKLQSIGIQNALALSQSEPKQMRQHFGVVMERIVNELRGISCIPLEDMPASKKQIMTSRSFGVRLTNHDDLRAVVTHFAAQSAEKLRQQQLTTLALTVFIETSRFDTHDYTNNVTSVFDVPTNNSGQLIHAACQGLKRIFKTGLSYQRAGFCYPI